MQLSPKQQSQGATLARPPGPRHLCHSHSTRGPFTAGPAGGAEGASLCKLLAPQLPVTPVARLGAGRVSAASGARQEGPWAMSPVPQITVCFYFQSPNHFFLFFFFLKKKKKKKTQKTKTSVDLPLSLPLSDKGKGSA